MTEASFVLRDSTTVEGALTQTATDSTVSDGGGGGDESSAHHAGTRIIVLFLLFFLGVVGNSLALVWIWNNRKRRSRVNNIVLGLATADFSVCVFTILVSVVYELQGYRWYAGNVGCKTIMALQTASLIASSFMLVIMALDRHQAIRAPLKEGFSVKKMTLLAWSLSLVLSVPQMVVWRVQDQGFATCRTNLNDKPHWRLVYITFGALVTFFVPFVVITVAYVRLSKKIWDKARETSGKARPSSSKKRKVTVQSTCGSSSLNRAKVKTLKMSAVIIVMFVLCGLPYFAVEMVRCYSLDRGAIDPQVYGIFGIFAVSNSAVNPYVFLWFNKRSRCLGLGPAAGGDAAAKKRRFGSRGASTSSYAPEDTTKTVLESRAFGRADFNGHDHAHRGGGGGGPGGHVNHGGDIRMDPIRENSVDTPQARLDINRNV